MRSISCSVCAEKYDSPQLGQENMGMPSITNRAAPLPKLRVTYLTWTAGLPQWAQRFSEDIGSDDDEFSGKTDFDDRLRNGAVKDDARDEDFGIAGLGVALALRDLPREDDVFEIKDGEVVIFKILGGMSRHDVVQAADQLS